MENDKIPTEVQEYIANFYEKTKCKVFIAPKSSSKLMRFVGWFFGVTKISPDFMTKYYTTIGNTIYIPDSALETQDEENLFRVIAHECIHIYDSKRFTGPLFKFLYLFPQSLAIFSILALLSFWKIKFLLCLLFLLGLLPLPAPFRYWFELRAYRTSIIFARKRDHLKDSDMQPWYDWIIKQLSTNLYYFTWPFPKNIQKSLLNESFMNKEEYKELIKWIAIKNVLQAYKGQKSK